MAPPPPLIFICQTTTQGGFECLAPKMLWQRLVVQSLRVSPCARHPLLCIKQYEVLLYFPLWGTLPRFEGTWKWLYRRMMKHELLFSCSTQAKRQAIELLILWELSFEYPPRLLWCISWGARAPNFFREQDHFCAVLWNYLQKESALMSSVNSSLVGFWFVFLSPIFNE